MRYRYLVSIKNKLLKNYSSHQIDKILTDINSQIDRLVESGLSESDAIESIGSPQRIKEELKRQNRCVLYEQRRFNLKRITLWIMIIGIIAFCYLCPINAAFYPVIPLLLIVTWFACGIDCVYKYDSICALNISHYIINQIALLLLGVVIQLITYIVIPIESTTFPFDMKLVEHIMVALAFSLCIYLIYNLFLVYKGDVLRVIISIQAVAFIYCIYYYDDTLKRVSEAFINPFILLPLWYSVLVSLFPLAVIINKNRGHLIRE